MKVLKISGCVLYILFVLYQNIWNKQIIKVNDAISGELTIKYGVLQGTKLSLILISYSIL